MDPSSTPLHLPPTLPFPIKIASLALSTSSNVDTGSRLLTYSFISGNDTLFGTWDSSIEGTLEAWNVQVGQTITSQEAKMNAAVMILEPCKHPIQIGGMCAVCGKDMTLMDYSGFADSQRAAIPITHLAKGPTVSLEEAQRLSDESTAHLLSVRKLSLIVDLDQTIVHATVDPTVGEWIAEGLEYEKEEIVNASTDGARGSGRSAHKKNVNPNWEALKDVRSFKLPVESVGLPPSMRDADGCTYYIKPRPGTPDFLTSLSELYEPHVYTMGTRSYATKVLEILDPDQKIFGGRVLSRDESGSISQKSLKRLFPCDTSMVVIIDDRADVWEWSPNLVKVVPYDFFVGIGDINSAFLPKQEPLVPAPHLSPSPPSSSTPSSPSSTSSSSLTSTKSLSTPPTSPATSNASKEDLRLVEQGAVLSAQMQSRPLAKEQEKLNDTAHAHTHSHPHGHARKSSASTASTTTKSGTSSRESTPTTPISGVPPVSLPLSSNVSASIVASSSTSSSTTITTSASTSASTSTASLSTLEATSSSSTISVSGNSENADADADDDEEDEDMDELDAPKALLKNDDRELDRVGRLLKEVHQRFFEAYDAAHSSSSGTGKKLKKGKGKERAEYDVKLIIPRMRMRTFAGLHLLFSSVIPLDQDPDKSEVWRIARAFGATCHSDLSHQVTHLVAAKPGTLKVDMARQRGTIDIVWFQWFTDSIALWTRVDELPYLLDGPRDRGYSGKAVDRDTKMTASDEKVVIERTLTEQADLLDDIDVDRLEGEVEGIDIDVEDVDVGAGGAEGDGVESELKSIAKDTWAGATDEVDAAMMESDSEMGSDDGNESDIISSANSTPRWRGRKRPRSVSQSPSERASELNHGGTISASSSTSSLSTSDEGTGSPSKSSSKRKGARNGQSSLLHGSPLTKRIRIVSRRGSSMLGKEVITAPSTSGNQDEAEDDEDEDAIGDHEGKRRKGDDDDIGDEDGDVEIAARSDDDEGDADSGDDGDGDDDFLAKELEEGLEEEWG
ncbi:hypothetical protein SISNIDRAFT_456546 [Sistotremastrum niveocremeum HHB9708]|uniref:protein-serine/threonine phosphatase n=1 Tax=Sistotremastrum niveocremeum HHB9708 TaxID=1314777 RepID=A0A164SMK4_9AGAM|nr:hypothetical protein SISNIDRAFT_456546 [Sistotremastrum niveocremeum HHB9708]